MKTPCRSVTCGLAAILLLFLIGAGFADCPPECPATGGGNKKADCFAEFQGVPVPLKRGTENPFGKKTLCTDGDDCDAGAAEDECTFEVGVCFNNLDTRLGWCVPLHTRRARIRVNGDRAATKRLRKAIRRVLPTSENLCSAPVTVTVPVVVKESGKKKAGKKTITLETRSGRSDPRTSVNRLTLTCNPAEVKPGCPANSAGGPNLLTLTATDGADLDAGWNGIGHNQGLIVGAKLSLCLEGCDLTTNPVCTATGITGPGSINSETFGPPLPLLAADVATCVVNRFAQDIRGTVNLQTGEIDLNVQLISKVYSTHDTAHPCPTCSGDGLGAPGSCQGGTTPGKSCVIEGTTVKFGNTSGTCLPAAADLADALDISLDPFTTGEARLEATIEGPGGRRAPCVDQFKFGDMNDCNDPFACTPADDPNTTCPSTDVANGENPGIDQACCPSKGKVGGCFLDDVVRAGSPSIPQPPWPDTTYPKVAAGGVTAATFCIPPTNKNVVNQSAGLPGPGAVLIPGDATIEFVELPW